MSIRLNLGCGPHLIPGFVNLDAATGWRFEDGLPDYTDESVEAATVSHSLMYVAAAGLPAVLAEIHRVLEPGGVLRVTEDNTEDPASERYGGFPGAVTLTGPRMMRGLLEQAGFTVTDHTAESTGFRDGSLLQAFHGMPPKVFFQEAVK